MELKLILMHSSAPMLYFKLYLMELKLSTITDKTAQHNFKLYLMELKPMRWGSKSSAVGALNCTLWN